MKEGFKMNNQKNETSNKPVCFMPNKEVYPLCTGKRNRFKEVFTTCQSCNLYEDMKEEN
jgi:hypothetical protein